MKLFPILPSAYACICSPNATTVKLALAVATSHTVDFTVAAFHAVDIAVAIMVKLGDHFPTIATAREAIQQFVLHAGESYKTELSDKKRYAICCKNSTCPFRIRANLARKKSEAVITVFIEHACSPAVHYKSKQSQSVCSTNLYYFRILITANRLNSSRHIIARV
jgi:hypothetical protein